MDNLKPFPNDSRQSSWIQVRRTHDTRHDDHRVKPNLSRLSSTNRPYLVVRS